MAHLSAMAVQSQARGLGLGANSLTCFDYSPFRQLHLGDRLQVLHDVVFAIDVSGRGRTGSDSWNC